MENKIEDIVLNCVKMIGEMEEKQELLNPTEDLRLFGGHGVMDSIGVVMLITEVEEQIESDLGRSITLADDRAMSQKTSPFRSVKSLVNYINKLLNTQGKG
ncbi:MAG: hypothetical protein QM479_07465 [Pseudomonadota bacterium]